MQSSMVMDGGKDQRKVDAHNIYIEVEVVKALMDLTGLCKLESRTLFVQ